MHGNAEIMEEFTSKNLIAIDYIVFLLYKKSTTFWDNPRILDQSQEYTGFLINHLMMTLSLESYARGP